MDYHASRRERLLGSLTEEHLDALLISSVYNVTYLTGFTGDSSCLVLTRQRAILVSDPRYVGQLADECPEVETHIRTPNTKLHEAIGHVLNKLGTRRVGCESTALTLAEAEALRQAAPTIDWKPASDRVEKLRMVKDAVEIAAIREAIQIAERAFTAFRGLLRPEDSEKELADAIEHYVRRCGGLKTAFPPILAVGERAALPHCPPTSRRIHERSFLLVDWGAMGPSGYRSDLTRVLPTHTKRSSADTQLAEIHAIVLQAQEAAFAAIHPGAIAKDVDAAARSVIEQAGYGSRFGHGLGHGIGLQIHEAPSVRGLSETKLVPGMIFTLEPGIYLPDWGGVRLEDNVLVTEDGVERLTTVPRGLQELSAFVPFAE